MRESVCGYVGGGKRSVCVYGGGAGHCMLGRCFVVGRGREAVEVKSISWMAGVEVEADTVSSGLGLHGCSNSIFLRTIVIIV